MLCKSMDPSADCYDKTCTGMNGEWDPSMWHLANELAGLGLQAGNRESPSLDHKHTPQPFGWTQAADEGLDGQDHHSYSSVPLDDSSAKGWGGQASPMHHAV